MSDALSYFDDVASLSRSGMMLNENKRRIAHLTAALSDMKSQLPPALQDAPLDAAKGAVDTLKGVCEARSDLAAQLEAESNTAALVASRAQAARAHVHEFDDASLVLNTLVAVESVTASSVAAVRAMGSSRLSIPPSLHGWSAEAEAAVATLQTLQEQRANVDERLQEQLSSSRRLCHRTAAARERLHRLTSARTVLSTLAEADVLAARVEAALEREGGAPHGREYGAAESSFLQPMLALHMLQARAAPSTARTVATGGAAPTAASTASGAEALSRVSDAMAVIVATRLRSLLPTLRRAACARLSDTLGRIEWPAASQLTMSAQGPAHAELRQAMCEALLLQYVSEAAAARAPEAESQTLNSESKAGLWALEPFLEPVLKRFRFHFEGRRETNRRDKPEWMFSHVCNLLRMHAPMLVAQVQPMLRSPMEALRNAAAEISGGGGSGDEHGFTGASALLAVSAKPSDLVAREQAAFVHMVSTGCPHGVFASLASALCGAMSAKLQREMPTLLGHSRIFAHTLSESMACERELRSSLGLPAGVKGVLHVFERHAHALQLWLRLEKEDAEAQLRAIMADESKWRLVDTRPAVLTLTAESESDTGGHSDAGAVPAPAGALSVMQLVRALTKRLELMTTGAAQQRLLHEARA